MAIFGTPQADEMTLIERDAANRAAAYENLKRSGDLPALGLIFGLNLMKNSQTQGFGQALGGAGMDALANHRAIMDARKKGIDADLNRQTELMRAQEQLNRQDRDYEFGLQKWDYQKEQDAIRNAMEQQRIAQAGASSAIAAKRLAWEMEQAKTAAERDEAARLMLQGILSGDPSAAFASPAPSTAAEEAAAQDGAAPVPPAAPELPQIADIPQPVEQDPFGAAPVQQTVKAPEVRTPMPSGTRQAPMQADPGIRLTPDQVRGLSILAASGTEAGKNAKSLLDLYYKQEQAANGKIQLVDGKLLNTATGELRDVHNQDGSVFRTAKQIEADQKAAEKAEAAQRKQVNALDSAFKQLDAIDRAIRLASDKGIIFDNTGVGGMLFSGVPGTDAFALASDLKTIGSGVMLSTLQNMKEASTTGASGFGSLSEKEGENIMASQGNLDQRQGREALIRNLENIRASYLRVLNAAIDDYGYTPEKVEAQFGKNARKILMRNTPQSNRPALSSFMGGK